MSSADGSYALVTGASSGIGKSIAQQLARMGYSIIAVSNESAQLQNFKDELSRAYQVNIETIDMDLSGSDAAQQVFDICMGQHWEVEVLVNNAGMLILGPANAAPVQKAQTLLSLHMMTTALLCRLFSDQMIQRRKGYILNVSSISAVMPYPIISFYGPSKTFIRAFTRALGAELHLQNIKVCCILPGAVDTQLYRDNEVNTALSMRLGVMTTPDKVAKAGIRALFKGRSECIPGLINKLSVWLMPLIPHWVIRYIYRWYFKIKLADRSNNNSQ